MKKTTISLRVTPELQAELLAADRVLKASRARDLPRPFPELSRLIVTVTAVLEQAEARERAQMRDLLDTQSAETARRD